MLFLLFAAAHWIPKAHARVAVVLIAMADWAVVALSLLHIQNHLVIQFAVLWA